MDTRPWRTTNRTWAQRCARSAAVNGPGVPTAAGVRSLPGALKTAMIVARATERSSMARKVFTPEDPALPMNYPGFVFRTLRDRGHPASALLAETGLDEGHLSDPDFRCGFQPLRRLLLNAINEAQNPHLGVDLALEFQPTYIGLPA